MASLGADLEAIRKDCGLSFDDVQQKTKLAPGIIASIEDGSIFDNLNRDKTYIRSYVRNYAKAVGIDDAKIVKALNQVEAGEYDGNLEDISLENSEPADSAKKEEPDEMVHDHSPEFEAKKPKAKSAGQNRADSQENIDWAKFSHKALQPKGSLITKNVFWGVLIIILAAAIVFLIIYFSDSSEPTETEEVPTVSQPIIPDDSLQESLLPQQDTSAASVNAPALSDTLTMSVIAATGKLEPVRVYTDLMGTRRPYWVELHDTLRFEFVDIFRVRATEQFDRMQLIFNGHIIENAYGRFYNTKSSMIELNRSVIEDHPEWIVSAENNESL